MTVDVWEHCYASNWVGIASAPCMAHPAKFSKGLIFRIVKHAIAEGWIAPGQTVLDPFGGVALGALPCLLQGIHWVGVELEPRFAQELGPANLALWAHRYGHVPGYGQAVLLCGDSRRLASVIQEQVACCVSSPPYAGLGMQGGASTVGTPPRPGDIRQYARTAPTQEYGTSDGQLGNLPPGSVAAAISSPPFCDSDQRKGGSDLYVTRRLQTGRDPHSASTAGFATQAPYGQSPGQLGALPPGAVEACISSPPWEDQEGAKGARKFKDPAAFAEEMARRLANGTMKGHGSSAAAYLKNMQADTEKVYGTTDGQLGTDHGTTFWEAAREIVAQVYALLKPGGHALWVVKNYIRAGKVVYFSQDWKRLCESLGFVTLHEHHALLVEDHGTQAGLFGAETDTTYKTAKKSFFRRIYEKSHPENSIDFEVVFCMEKRCENE